MNKFLLLSLSAFLLTGCADKSKYEEAVLAQMQKEADIKDYKIAPEYMTECVVDTTSTNMPGIFALDPKRLLAYRNYTKMLTLTESEDPKKVLEELRTDFGSAKDLAEARTNYTESLMECYTAVISKAEKIEQDKAADAASSAPAVATPESTPAVAPQTAPTPAQ